MDKDEIIRSGYLFIPSQSFLKLKQSWNRKYFVLHKRSPSGVQRLELFETQEAHCKKPNCIIKIIPLNECHKVAITTHKHQSNVFEIRTRDSVHLLSAETYQQMTEWLESLRKVAFQLTTNGSTVPNTAAAMTVTCSPINNGVTSNSSVDMVKLVENGSNGSKNGIVRSDAVNPSGPCPVTEENLLYSSVDAPQVFRVKIIESEATVRCKLLASHYYLVLTSVSISLAEELTSTRQGKILWTWPYRHIRRYGCTKDGFSLEAGRKCLTGEGLFSFITSEGSSIFKCVASHVSSLKITHPNGNGPITISRCSSELSSSLLPLLPTTAKTLSHNKLNNNGHRNGFNGLSNNHQTRAPGQRSKDFRRDLRSSSSSPEPPTLPTQPRPNQRDSSKSPIKYLNKDQISLNGKQTSSMTTKTNELISGRHSVQPESFDQNRLILLENRPASEPKIINDVSASPPVIKPPRRNRMHGEVTRNLEKSDLAPDPLYEDPIFVSREELFGLNIEEKEENHYEIPVCPDGSIEVTVSDLLENGDRKVDVKFNGLNKVTRFNPQMSRLTAAIKSMFSGNLADIVSSSNRKSVKLEKFCQSSSDGSYSSLSSGPTVSLSSTESPKDFIDSSNDSPYSEISEISEEINQGSEVDSGHGKEEEEMTVINKIESTSIHDKSHVARPTVITENDYVNLLPEVNLVVDKLIEANLLTKTATANVTETINPDHYIQNDAEYALVMKRSISCGKL